MPLSKTAICNLALVRIGVQQPIASTDEQSAAADSCNAVYAHSIESVLRATPWPFSQRYETLGLVATNPNNDWGYSYRYPTSMLRIGRLTSTVGASTVGSSGYIYTTPTASQPDVAFVIGSDVAGMLIYTNMSGAVALGTAYITNEALFDPLFVDALAWRIAAEVAMGLTKDSGIAAFARNKAESSASLGYATSRNESVPNPPRESSFVDARN